MYGAGDSAQPFETVEDYERWMRRARQFPTWVDAAIAAMREGMASGVTVPREAMARTVPSLEAIATDRLEESVFYAPVEATAGGLAEARQQRLREAMTALIRDTLNPSYTAARRVRPRRVPASLPGHGRLDGAA